MAERLSASLRSVQFRGVSLVNQEVARILWTVEVHYHVHRNLPLFPILSQITAVHIIQSRLKMGVNVILPSVIFITLQIVLNFIPNTILYTYVVTALM
jgi:hypothetical protein